MSANSPSKTQINPMSTTQEKAVYSNAWILLLASLTALGPLSIDNLSSI
ncbi:hypothetical protein ACNFX6_12605 [Acinetobacter johnsonii]